MVPRLPGHVVPFAGGVIVLAFGVILAGIADALERTRRTWNTKITYPEPGLLLLQQLLPTALPAASFGAPDQTDGSHAGCFWQVPNWTADRSVLGQGRSESEGGRGAASLGGRTWFAYLVSLG